MTDLVEEVARRRTFAIISHPDAGKTTLTEKLLLFGGALQFAGAVRAKGKRQRTRSDWMQIEQQRGISVMTSVMTFEYANHIFNMLDTPGHEDFCEDTFRTLSAVDSAIMVIDAAKGIEEQTLKLFEVCRLRDMPVLTFINKIDQEGRDPFELLDEIEKSLALDTSPVNWPIGSGRNLVGLYDLRRDCVFRCDQRESFSVSGPDDPRLQALLSPADSGIPGEIALAQESCTPFDLTSYREGHLSPVFFGSALRDIGIVDLIDSIVQLAPMPGSQVADTRVVHPKEESMTGFVFKIQANMDPNHRDRIAFLRVSSGVLRRGMKVRISRDGKTIALRTPQFFFAQERSLAEEAVAGDVVGIHNHALLRIGDTLTEGENLTFHGVPSFAPEVLRRIRSRESMRSGKMYEALRQLAEEGVVQIFSPLDGTPMLIGVVGVLQLDVLITRMKNEYNLSIALDTVSFREARWITSEDPEALERFIATHRSAVAEDLDGSPVFLADSQFMLKYAAEQAKEIHFDSVKAYQRKSGVDSSNSR